MTPPARVAAAIEVLADIAARRRPAVDALKDWGLTHRFAGSGDRAAIAGLVYDALRRRASSAWIMGDEAERAVLIGSLRERGVEAVERLFEGSRYGPSPLTGEERLRLMAGASLADAPAHVRGDYPEWLDPHLTRAFGPAVVEEAAALAARAPLDLRVNTLKGDRESALVALSGLHPQAARWSPWGLRIALGVESRSPAIQAEEAFIKGRVEVQDEGSQIAALLCAARPGEDVIDLCAGAGGKTLALAAMMEGKGRLYATDSDKRRLAPIHARLERAGARNVQVKPPGADLPACDLVVIDAPCTGIGAWRRNPDAKWRTRPGALALRRQDQREVMDRAAPLVKPGGRLAYITCSMIEEENGDQVADFLRRHSQFTPVAPQQATEPLGERAMVFRRAVSVSADGILMTPRRTDTDGFYVSVLRRV